MNFQEDIPSIPIQICKIHDVILFDLTSMQGATEICDYPELVREPLRLEPNFNFFPEHLTELSVLGERMYSFVVDKHGFNGKKV